MCGEISNQKKVTDETYFRGMPHIVGICCCCRCCNCCCCWRSCCWLCACRGAVSYLSSGYVVFMDSEDGEEGSKGECRGVGARLDTTLGVSDAEERTVGGGRWCMANEGEGGEGAAVVEVVSW